MAGHSSKSERVVYKTVGVMPSGNAIKGLSPEDLKFFTYRTTYSTGVSGRVAQAEDKGENFLDVHGIGRKDTKYMKYQKAVAPLLDHSACSTRRDFVPLPLGDHEINSQLAKSFAGGVQSSKKSLNIEFKNESQYSLDFGPLEPEKIRSAKQKSTKPKQGRTRTISSMNEMMETRPMSHLTFAPPHAELARAAEIVLAKGNLCVSGWNGPPATTSYHTEFGRSQTSSAPALVSMSQLTGALPKELLPADDPAFKIRRACFLSPGQ